MTAADINQRLRDLPFHPFRIHLSDGSSIPVMDSTMVLVAESSAIIPTEMGHDSQGYPLVKQWRTVALSHMVQFSDLDEPISGLAENRALPTRLGIDPVGCAEFDRPWAA